MQLGHSAHPYRHAAVHPRAEGNSDSDSSWYVSPGVLRFLGQAGDEIEPDVCEKDDHGSVDSAGETATLLQEERLEVGQVEVREGHYHYEEQREDLEHGEHVVEQVRFLRATGNYARTKDHVHHGKEGSFLFSIKCYGNLYIKLT